MVSFGDLVRTNKRVALSSSSNSSRTTSSSSIAANSFNRFDSYIADNELTNATLVEISNSRNNNGDNNQRKQKRLPLRTSLFLRRPFNSAMYGKPVQTINISAQGLLVVCDVSLELGAELEVSNISRDIMVTAIVKHVTKDPKTNKYLLGLSISDKKTNWFVNELVHLDYFSKSSTSRNLSLDEDYVC